ncbi:uncharacterized protein TNCV_1156401 [Trichonephila clavipes]|nr:uncharacterized protein TNCV_1156401 [Trichonephila clavipes]
MQARMGQTSSVNSFSVTNCISRKYGVYTVNLRVSELILTSHCSATRGLLATDHVILNHGQVTWTTPELAPPLLTTTPHQREDVSALDRFNVHRCPTRRVFSGTGIELMTCLPWLDTLTTGLPQPSVNLRTPETLVMEHWMEPEEEGDLVTEYMFKLINRLKRCQEVAINKMEEMQVKRKTWYDKKRSKT